jgi:hypothetical protein
MGRHSRAQGVKERQRAMTDYRKTEVIDEIKAYIAKNGGDLVKTRAICREDKG